MAILLLLVVTVIGVSAVNTTTFDLQISGNKRASDQAFYVAESGINEFLGRFQQGATGAITDNAPSNPDWSLYLAINDQRAAEIGYSSSNSNHIFVQSLPQINLDFAVEVRHKVNSAEVITYGGYPIYITRSHGLTVDGGRKVIEVELKKGSGLDPPSAVYSKSPVYVRGSSTYIQGNDQCGSNHLPGVITSTSTIDENGNPTIQGSPQAKIFNSTLNIDIQGIINELKGIANFTYNYNSNTTLTGYLDSWGIPASQPEQTQPLLYNGTMNIVYFNMNGKTLKLAGGSHGAGILLVDGDLELNGNFSWYGVVVVKGALDYTAGGYKNITGSILAGESVNVEVDIGGGAVVIYCSTSIDNAKKIIPFRMSWWREIF